jgi:hypothetical protein
MWEEMLAYAKEKDLKGGNFKKLNLPFESKLLSQPEDIRLRMAKRVESSDNWTTEKIIEKESLMQDIGFCARGWFLVKRRCNHGKCRKQKNRNRDTDWWW